MVKQLSSIRIDEITAEVINLVRLGVAATRPELVRKIGLGRAAVNERVEQALRSGVIVDGEVGLSTGGRAPRLLEFVASTGTVYVIDVGTRHLAVAITDLAGQPLATNSAPWDMRSGPSEALSQAWEMLTDLAKAVNHVGDAWGIGVGLPGPVDFPGARPVVSAPMLPGWDNYDIRAWFAERTSAPAWADNDLNILLFGIWNRTRRGDDDPDHDAILVKVSNGIGAGLLSYGLVHRGRSGSAGDIGHVTLRSGRGVRCRCGQLDCLEAMAGGWALARDGKIAADDGSSPFLAQRVAEFNEITATDVALGAQHADQVCVDLVVRSATLLGEQLADLVTFFNPATIYIGGILPEIAGDLYLISVRRAVYQHSRPIATRDLTIAGTAIDHQDALSSTALLVIDQLFDVRRLPLWLAAGHPGAVEGMVADTR